MDLDGSLMDIDKFDFDGHENLRKFAQYEIAKSRAVDAIPPHVDLMRRLEMVDYEPGSDSGNMRFYPKGRLVKSLLENYVLEKAMDMEPWRSRHYHVRYGTSTLKKYLDRFPARQYQIEAEKNDSFCGSRLVLASSSWPWYDYLYKSLPLKMFEITRYSFRREQRGELVGIRRLRAFTMPDMHTMAKDMSQAIEEFKKQYETSISVLNDMAWI